VVNVDARESDTRPIAIESLKSAPGSAVTVARDEDELLLSGKTRQLWPLLAGTAAALLGLEMLLLSLWRRPRIPSSIPNGKSNFDQSAIRNPQSAIHEEAAR
jgi:hypothetical protein